MGGNPRDHVEGEGFWEGGSAAHGNARESSGRASGYPGPRKPTRVGVVTDLEKPFRPALSFDEQDDNESI